MSASAEIVTRMARFWKIGPQGSPAAALDEAEALRPLDIARKTVFDVLSGPWNNSDDEALAEFVAGEIMKALGLAGRDARKGVRAGNTLAGTRRRPNRPYFETVEEFQADIRDDLEALQDFAHYFIREIFVKAYGRDVSALAPHSRRFGLLREAVWTRIKDDFISVSDLAARAGVDTSYVRAEISRGTLPGRMIGRSYVIPADAAAEWLEADRRGSRSGE